MSNPRITWTAAVPALLLTMSFMMALATVPETISAYEAHDPIYIDGDADFTPANGVTGGSGTASDPYIIEGWDIDVTTAHGIRVQYTAAHFIIRDCHVHDGGTTYYGIYLHGCSNGIVTDNTCSYNRHGIFLSSSSNNNTLSGNNCSNNDYGIYLSSSSNNNTLSGNNCNSNLNHGIALGSSSNNTLRGNNCSSNHNDGILLVGSGNNTLSGNSCSCNDYHGISLYLSGNNTLVNNDCSHNLDGIALYSSGNNTLYKNNASSNGAWGVYLLDSTGTTVYHNIFFDNIVNHAYDNRGSENHWNASYPVGGNFWDNYTGVDAFSGPDQDENGLDGIGDMPYEIDADSLDCYPLMELPNAPPTASFTASPSSGYVDTVFSVDASSSSDMEDDVSDLQVRWDWESDGIWNTAWSAVKTATHQYSAEGTYTITLEVSDSNGLVGSTTRQVTVVSYNAPPVADAGPDQTVAAGAHVTFDGSRSSDDVGIVSYTWTFIYNDEARRLYGVSPRFTFDIAGTYVVTLTVDDAGGEMDTDTVTIIVEEEDGKSFIGSYGLPLGVVIALAVIALIMFFVLKGRKGGKVPNRLEEMPTAEQPESRG